MRVNRKVMAPFAALALTTSCGLGGPAYDKPPPEVDAVVDMTTTLDYSPKDLTINVGDTVEWRNTSIMPHTVTADPELADDPSHVQLPPGAEKFNSGSVKPGDVYRKQFTVPGGYTYFCIPHEQQGMIGRLIVKPVDQ